MHANTALTLMPAQLLVNDTDADSDTLQIAAVQAATNGSVALQSGNVVFTPTTGHVGSASFSYTVSDPGGLTTTNC